MPLLYRPVWQVEPLSPLVAVLLLPVPVRLARRGRLVRPVPACPWLRAHRFLPVPPGRAVLQLAVAVLLVQPVAWVRLARLAAAVLRGLLEVVAERAVVAARARAGLPLVALLLLQLASRPLVGWWPVARRPLVRRVLKQEFRQLPSLWVGPLPKGRKTLTERVCWDHEQ